MRSQSDAIYIAAGTQASRLLDIPGEDACEGVESGVGFLKRVGPEARPVRPEPSGGDRRWQHGHGLLPGPQSASAQSRSPLSTAERRRKCLQAAEEVAEAREEGDPT